MCERKAVEELNNMICKGCKTRHDCENNDGFCIMSDVVAEYLLENGYGKISKVGKGAIKDIKEKLQCCLAAKDCCECERCDCDGIAPLREALDCINYLEAEKEKACKDTAKELAKKLLDCGKECEDGAVYPFDIHSIVKELYGVEINE